MWALVAALAVAAPPPNVDLEDIDRWEEAAEAVLDMPGGCWEWVGQASWDWRTRKYSTRGDAVFAGKTSDGVWGEVHLQPLGELLAERRGDAARVYERSEARFYPLVGKLVGGRVVVHGDEQGREMVEGAEAINVLRSAIRRISGDAFTSWAEWDDARGGVVLTRAIPLAAGRADEIDVQVFFPGGGTAPSALDVTFPAKFRVGRWPGWSVRDAEVHVRGLIRGNQVFPSSEAFRFDYRFLGVKFHGAQTVVYKRITRCAGPPPGRASADTVVMPDLPRPPEVEEPPDGPPAPSPEPVPADVAADAEAAVSEETADAEDTEAGPAPPDAGREAGGASASAEPASASTDEEGAEETGEASEEEDILGYPSDEAPPPPPAGGDTVD